MGLRPWKAAENAEDVREKAAEPKAVAAAAKRRVRNAAAAMYDNPRDRLLALDAMSRPDVVLDMVGALWCREVRDFNAAVESEEFETHEDRLRCFGILSREGLRYAEVRGKQEGEGKGGGSVTVTVRLGDDPGDGDMLEVS